MLINFLEELLDRLSEEINDYYKKCKEPIIPVLTTLKIKGIVLELASKYSPNTRGDVIRNASDEELAKFTITHIFSKYICGDGMIFDDEQYEEALKYEIKWLKSDAKGE